MIRRAEPEDLAALPAIEVYARLGFRVVPSEEWGPGIRGIVAAEALQDSIDGRGS